jgi:DNA-binding Xre family transcriptional regulator
MKISYNKLWHLLIDLKMNKQDLKRVSGISTASIAKLGRGENLQTDVLLKICKALNVGINDIMETVIDEDKKEV